MKRKWKNKFHGSDLYLNAEPSANEVIAAIGDPKKFNEIVFCGFGDCLIRLEESKEIARWIKQNGGKVRINTAGLANKFWGRNILPELSGLVDAISISLNGSNPKEHNEINRPNFGEESFDAILDFVRKAKECIPSVTITAVDFDFLDTSKVEKIAQELGVNFRLRKYEE
jgi:TatD DNase family protein